MPAEAAWGCRTSWRRHRGGSGCSERPQQLRSAGRALAQRCECDAKIRRAQREGGQKAAERIARRRFGGGLRRGEPGDEELGHADGLRCGAEGGGGQASGLQPGQRLLLPQAVTSLTLVPSSCKRSAIPSSHSAKLAASEAPHRAHCRRFPQNAVQKSHERDGRAHCVGRGVAYSPGGRGSSGEPCACLLLSRAPPRLLQQQRQRARQAQAAVRTPRGRHQAPQCRQLRL